ncbi:hypothetical protein GALL_44030 [mine drainage metagenome]|uniref:Uncharacterized protein n=1 Tax=mine drainage metagenome TaxID=410659 RepID=A0A1J5T1D8_9ZZZZ
MRKEASQGLLLAGLLAGSFFLAEASAGAINGSPGTDTLAQANGGKQKFAGSRPSMYFKRTWGIDVVGVHPVSSGQMLAFRYRVLDEVKAKALFDKTLKPYLIDEATGTRLAVPSMENVGDLRQDVTPEPDRIYYMIFGNPGKLVKQGSRVSIVIGNFHIDGLIVD